MKKKIVSVCLVVCLLATAIIGTTLAYFTDSTQKETNTFTMGKVDIELDEPQWDAGMAADEEYNKLVPSTTITKDPTVTVVEGSEDCYVFVKVEKGNNVDNYLTYSIDTTKWTALGDGYEGIYYLNYTTNPDENVDYTILTDNQVTVKSDVTGVAQGDELTLSFTAYAVQTSGDFADAQAAWNATFGKTEP